MRLSELQSKKIIDITSGCSLGNVIDVIFSNDGKIQYLLFGSNRSFSLFNKEDDEKISWNQVTKIGEDVILVKKD